MTTLSTVPAESIKEVALKPEYRSTRDDVARDFYLPLLERAVAYDRAVGFFSSTALAEISVGIASLAQRGGKIRLVASPHLSPDDLSAIEQGYDERNAIVEGALIRELREPKNRFEEERLNLLSHLIADGVLDIRIACTADSFGSIGMYHEKMGLIYDADENCVAFSGSMNESATAMMSNYEAFDVFCSWTSDRPRVEAKMDAFDKIWTNKEKGLSVLPFPSVNRVILERYKRFPVDYDIDRRHFNVAPIVDRDLSLRTTVGPPELPALPSSVELRPYQDEAINQWVNNGYRGIYEMATGTGKTFTGLAAVSRLAADLDEPLTVFITCPYQHLVDQWAPDARLFGCDPIIAHSASPDRKWQSRLDKALRVQRFLGQKFVCVITTNATFKSEFIQKQINKIKGKKLIVADEAHNMGAGSFRSVLDDRFDFRLALSATLDRHYDDEGTTFLRQYFGPTCINYGLRRAIEEGMLTQYKYYPILTYLEEDELAEYNELTAKMRNCVMYDRHGHARLTKQGEIIAMQRSRLVAGARQKLTALREAIEPYRDKRNMLVYCGATNISDEDSFDEIDADGQRQIDAVTYMLGHDLDMAVSQFTARESAAERQQIREAFESEHGLQAIVAIKCLDEGVNIPGTRTAFILASTSNPKEYIQRRGRVLRTAEGKDFAEIYDFVVLPRSLKDAATLPLSVIAADKALVMRELSRMVDFADLALNNLKAYEAIWSVQKAYDISSIDASAYDDLADSIR